MTTTESLNRIREMADRYFLQMACEEAQKSPDPSTKNGAVVVAAYRISPEHYCKDCNRFSVLPYDLSYDINAVADAKTNRDTRLAWIEHAERNALWAAFREGVPTAGATLYCPYAACTDCAKAIVLSGVKRLVRLGADKFNGFPERWRGSIKIADKIMAVGGVTVEDYAGPSLDMTYWLDGKEWKV